jgi:hypothetical protein
MLRTALLQNADSAIAELERAPPDFYESVADIEAFSPLVVSEHDHERRYSPAGEEIATRGLLPGLIPAEARSALALRSEAVSENHSGRSRWAIEDIVAGTRDGHFIRAVVAEEAHRPLVAFVADREVHVLSLFDREVVVALEQG